MFAPGSARKFSSTRLAALSAAVALTGSLLAAAPAAARGDVTGIWYDDTGRGAVRLQPCGSRNQSVCGYIVWLKQKQTSSGQPLTDALNPNPRQRKRPICGLQVIGRLKPQQDGSWDNGWIYDPKQGQSFDVAVQRLSDDKLQITGYLGVKFLGKKLVWHRAPANVGRCDGT